MAQQVIYLPLVNRRLDIAREIMESWDLDKWREMTDDWGPRHISFARDLLSVGSHGERIRMARTILGPPPSLRGASLATRRKIKRVRRVSVDFIEFCVLVLSLPDHAIHKMHRALELNEVNAETG